MELSTVEALKRKNAARASKEQIIESIQVIISNKKRQLEEMNHDGKELDIDYAVLSVEIEDAEYILESANEELDGFFSRVRGVASQTTSGSIYNLIGPHLAEYYTDFTHYTGRENLAK